jgi:hypothetical protein
MENNELKAKILILEELLKFEVERADRNYDTAVFFESLYNKAVDWATNMDTIDNE